MTRSKPESPFISVVYVTLSIFKAISRSLRRPLRLMLSKLAVILEKAFAMLSILRAPSRTGMSLFVKAHAIPEPIVPTPITAASFTSRGLAREKVSFFKTSEVKKSSIRFLDISDCAKGAKASNSTFKPLSKDMVRVFSSTLIASIAAG